MQFFDMQVISEMGSFKSINRFMIIKYCMSNNKRDFAIVLIEMKPQAKADE